MNLVYGLAPHEFSVAQVDRAPAPCLGGHRFESCRGLRFFLMSHACDMLINSFSHFDYVSCVLESILDCPIKFLAK